jgi:hypothetical protein
MLCVFPDRDDHVCRNMFARCLLEFVSQASHGPELTPILCPCWFAPGSTLIVAGFMVKLIHSINSAARAHHDWVRWDHPLQSPEDTICLVYRFLSRRVAGPLSSQCPMLDLV